MTADVEINAAYASVVEDEGTLFVGFPEGEDETDPYVLFRQETTGGPVWFEMDDEFFGADDAVETLDWTDAGLTIHIAEPARARLGQVAVITVSLPVDCEDRAEAEAALAQMLGARFRRV
jgi:hypothetical protein